LVDVPFSASSSDIPGVFDQSLLEAPEVMMDIYTNPDVYALMSDRQIASIEQLLGQMG